MSIGLTADEIFFNYLTDAHDISESTKNLIVDAISANNEKIAEDIAKIVKEVIENK